MYMYEGEYSTMNENRQLIPEPAGWYYTGFRFTYNKELDLGKYSGVPFTTAVDTEFNFSDHEIILEKLKEKNDIELTKAISEKKYWSQEHQRFSISNPKITRLIQFYETIIYQFKRWYDLKGLITPELKSEPILQSPDQDGKILFVGSRKEFTNLVLKNVNDIPLSKKTRLEYAKYRFSFPWTEKACLSYIRQEKNKRDHPIGKS